MITKWLRILVFSVPIVLFTIHSLSLSSVILPSDVLGGTRDAPTTSKAASLNDCTSPPPTVISNDSTYHILCTTYHTRWKWGSYQIRCRDLKSWADTCAPQVRIHLHPLIGKGRMEDQVGFGGKLEADNCTTYNATMGVKWIFDDPHPRFGKLLLDVVDDYNIKQEHVPANVQVITQNSHHAKDLFPDRTHYAVEHWFNSYPEDMISPEKISFEIPQVADINISEANPLRMATVWTNDNWPCPNLTTHHTTYQCMDENYMIANWHPKYMNPMNSSILFDRFHSMLNDSQLGPGRLYYELFWMFDVLVIPVKRQNAFKLKYGNVQRAVSQMRSGVPVLMEVYEHVVQGFMDQYNYTCAFGNDDRYWSFDQAVEEMKNPKLRKQCQQEGLRIAKAHYSPSHIAKKHLRALGYSGPFMC